MASIADSYLRSYEHRHR